jgi:RNA 2',3'-cyclic 3'-phosphodiesterase
MRLFVALEVPEPARREVRRRLAGLRERLPRARWVDPEVLHVTLQFLGEVAGERAAPLADALRDAAAGFAPLPLRLARGGTFPPGRPARVAWVGVEAPPEIAALQAALASAAKTALSDAAKPALSGAAKPALDDPAAYGPPERPFRAHVTVARCPSPWPRGAAEKFAGAFPGEIGPPWVAHAAVLLESRLAPQGPRYRLLADLPLAAGEAAP